jgi:hypothetical protein
MLSIVIKRQIEERYGRPIRYPKDCEALAVEISSQCKERISPSTVKRIYGFVKGTQEPRLFTLYVLAKYLDCPSWEDLLNKTYKIEIADHPTIKELSVEDLNTGDQIEFQYEPGRKVVVVYKEQCVFEVVNAEDNKFQTGDRFKTQNFILNYPLIANEVSRDGIDMGQLKAGIVSGLTSIRKL